MSNFCLNCSLYPKPASPELARLNSLQSWLDEFCGMSVSEWLLLNMQSGWKQCTSCSRAQKANRFWQTNSLVIRRAKLNNGLWGKCACVCSYIYIYMYVYVCVWWDREGDVGWPYSVASLPWPISFNQAAWQALPFLARHLSIRPPAPTRVLH